MGTKNKLYQYPTNLRIKTGQHEVIYTLSSVYYAVKCTSSYQCSDREEILMIEEGGDIFCILEGDGTFDTEMNTTAVYQGEGGLLCVPTGRIFVRLETNCFILDKKDEFKELGFVVSEIIPYAPNAAWLEREDKNIAASLQNIDELKNLNSVCHVEPQLISKRNLRQDEI
ncbi:MAG: hypothetical protein NZM04_01035 [Methylacidiphilales bacterium]|nr:hypothetical protein [Candidatus Methylacidiphilales bacterium]